MRLRAQSSLSATMGSPEWREKVDSIYKSFVGEEGKRWARPDAPILNDLPDEKAEPHVFFHNTNYRISRKYINVEKVKVSPASAGPCEAEAGTLHACEPGRASLEGRWAR